MSVDITKLSAEHINNTGPFNNRHNSVVPSMKINLNNSKWTGQDTLYADNAPNSARAYQTPHKPGETISRANGNYLKDPILNFDDDVEEQKVRFENQLKLKN